MADPPMQGDPTLIFTIGHSNHAPERFIDLLRDHHIEVLVDVRSQPYSRYTSHFNHDILRSTVTAAGIRYLFLGRELGGRPDDDEFYDADDHVLYSRVARSPLFQQGIERLQAGITQYRVAIMCSEEDPTTCHRRLLVGRVLDQQGVEIQHIRGTGQIEREENGCRGDSLTLPAQMPFPGM